MRRYRYTYNDPVIWAEYAIDIARLAREAASRTSSSPPVRHSGGEARGLPLHDATNVDLKAFSEDFYRHVTLSHLEPVKETLVWLKHETDVWFEITTLLIPGRNDSDRELNEECDWIVAALARRCPSTSRHSIPTSR